MINKDRIDHPERYEVTVYDTAQEKIVEELQCFGVVIGLIKEVEITGRGEDIDGFYYSAQPRGVNTSPQDIATLIFGLVDMFPEVKPMLEDMMEGTTVVEFIPESEDQDEDESYD